MLNRSANMRLYWSGGRFIFLIWRMYIAVVQRRAHEYSFHRLSSQRIRKTYPLARSSTLVEQGLQRFCNRHGVLGSDKTEGEVIDIKRGQYH